MDSQQSQSHSIFSHSLQAFLASQAGRDHEILGELGHGAMGVVLHARDHRLNRDVAMKVMCNPGSRADYLLRFQREARTLARLEHPNIARVYDIGFEAEIPYIIMEYINGSNLKSCVQQSLNERREVPDFDWTIDIFKELAGALDHCHEKGILHRDVKPQNIMIEKARERPVLIDFGLIGKTVQSLDESVPGFSLSLSAEGSVCGLSI